MTMELAAGQALQKCLDPLSTSSLDACNTAVTALEAGAEHVPNGPTSPATCLQQRESDQSQQSPALHLQPDSPAVIQSGALQLIAASADLPGSPSLPSSRLDSTPQPVPVTAKEEQPQLQLAAIHAKQDCSPAAPAELSEHPAGQPWGPTDHTGEPAPASRSASRDRGSAGEPSRSDGPASHHEGPHAHAKWHSHYVRLKKQHQLPLTPSRLLHLPSYLAEELLDLKQCVNDGFVLQVEADGVMDASSWPASLSVYKNATGYNYYRIAGSRPLANKYQGWIIQGWAAVGPTTVCMVLSSKPSVPTVIDFEGLKRPSGAGVERHGARESKKLRTGASTSGLAHEATSHKAGPSQAPAATAAAASLLQAAAGLPNVMAGPAQQAAGIAQLQAGLQMCTSMGLSVPAALASALQQLAQPVAAPTLALGAADASSMAQVNQQLMLLSNSNQQGNTQNLSLGAPLNSSAVPQNPLSTINTTALTNFLLSTRQAASSSNPAPAQQPTMFTLPMDMSSSMINTSQVTAQPNLQVFITPSGQLAIQAAPQPPASNPLAAQVAQLCMLQGLSGSGSQQVQLMGQPAQQDNKQHELAALLAANGLGLSLAPGLMAAPQVPQVQMQAMAAPGQQVVYVLQPQQVMQMQQQPEMMLMGQQQLPQEWATHSWTG